MRLGEDPPAVGGAIQHWVPRFLIKEFADTDGRIFRLDVHSDRVTKPPPKHAASRPSFNEFEIDGQPFSFEGRLARIESNAAPAIRRILNARSLALTTPRDRVGICQFIAVQSFRTDAFTKGIAHLESRSDLGLLMQQAWRSAFLVAGDLARRRWAVMTATGADHFYLGDNPVVLQRTENPRDGKSLGFDVVGVEAFMPLSPTCALWMPCPSVGDQLVTGYENAIALHRTVRQAVLSGDPGGHRELEIAQRVIRSGHDIYVAVTNGVALQAKPENVENLNYLQCSWASEAIYSDRDDFDFARRVFRENPQYRSVPKTTMVELS